MNISQVIVLHVIKKFRLLWQNGFESRPKNSTPTCSKKLVYCSWYCINWEGGYKETWGRETNYTVWAIFYAFDSFWYLVWMYRNMQAILLKHLLYIKHCNPGAWQSCKLHKCMYRLKGTLTELHKAVPEESWIYATKTVQVHCPIKFPQKTEKTALPASDYF